MSAHESHVFSPDGVLVQSPGFLTHDWLLHGATTRRFVEAHDTLEAGMHRLLRRLGADGMAMVRAQQMHTNRVGVVAQVPEAQNGYAHVLPETDAIVCCVPEVCLFVFTADCVPVFLCDMRTRVVALVHAGWRGTLARIVERTLEAMQEIGCHPQDIAAWIGPCIGYRSYEVSAELIGRFRTEFADALRNGVPFSDGRLLDLTALNVHQLLVRGVPPARITVSGLCTFQNRALFHSYRGGNGAAGRIVSAIAVRKI